MNKGLLLGLLPLLFLSCGDGSGEANEVEEKTTSEVDPYEGIEEELDGGELLVLRCYSCHNTQGTDNMLAPPMHRVKEHYINKETTRGEFIHMVLNWVKDPTVEKSHMPGAREQFGLMPKQEFDTLEVKAIAGYLYDNEL